MHRGPHGNNFRILGVNFHTKLLIGDAINKCVRQCTWKLQSILRAKRYYTIVEQISLYKAHILSYIEYRTPAIAHASATTLAPLDAIQNRLLRELDISAEEALIRFRLAPLHARRDIAMLGVIHRAARGQGPAQLRSLFPLRYRQNFDEHPFQIEDISADCNQDYMKRTTFGYIAIYNNLPTRIVMSKNVKDFQKSLQKLLMDRISAGDVEWQNFLRR